MNDTNKLSDAEYILEMIDETFASVPQIKARHDRIRAIAARLATPPALPAIIAPLGAPHESTGTPHG